MTMNNETIGSIKAEVQLVVAGNTVKIGDISLPIKQWHARHDLSIDYSSVVDVIQTQVRKSIEDIWKAYDEEEATNA